jgi:hypothetical protein
VLVCAILVEALIVLKNNIDVGNTITCGAAKCQDKMAAHGLSTTHESKIWTLLSCNVFHLALNFFVLATIFCIFALNFACIH